jgi:uncharacterized protein involved in exopolysaccharide biosynthesis
MNSQRTGREIVSLISARRYLVLGVALAVLCTAVTITFFMPRKYESSVTVQLVGNHVLHNLYGRELTDAKGIADRIGRIPEEVVSSDAVGEVIAALGLDRSFADEPSTIRAQKLAALEDTIQKGTRVKQVGNDKGKFTYCITHVSVDPVQALRIATQLAATYQNRAFAAQESSSIQALAELRAQRMAIEERATAAATALACFMEENSEHSFGEQSPADAEHEQTVAHLHDVTVEIGALEQQLENIRGMLKDEPQWVEAEEEISGEVEAARIREEIREAVDELIALEGKHPDFHPAVADQKAKLAALKAELAAVGEGARTVTKKVENQTFVELRKSELEALSALTIANRRKGDFETRLTEYEAKRASLPDLESEWARLKEEKATLDADLSDIVARESQARLGLSAQLAQTALIYDLMEPPVLPEKPVSPNQLLIAIVGLVLGLGLGLGSVLLIDTLDQSFRTTNEVAELLEVPVLRSITKIETASERAKIKRKRRVARVAVLALFILTATALYVQLSSDGDVGSLMEKVLKATE